MSRDIANAIASKITRMTYNLEERREYIIIIIILNIYTNQCMHVIYIYYISASYPRRLELYPPLLVLSIKKQSVASRVEPIGLEDLIHKDQ
jgi:hypothetical protein